LFLANKTASVLVSVADSLQVVIHSEQYLNNVVGFPESAYLLDQEAVVTH
jgi:hypothetical protein